MAILPANTDFTRNNFMIVTINGITADCIKNGKINNGTTRSSIPYFLPPPRPAKLKQE